MAARVLDGRALAERMRLAAAQDLQDLAAAGRIPALVLVRVGDHPAALGRQSGLERAAAAWGVETREVAIPVTVRSRVVARRVRALARDRDATGVVLLRPLGGEAAEHEVVDALPPRKDVEGIHPETLGRVLRRRPAPAPSFAGAVLTLLESARVALDGARAVLVGSPTGDLEVCAAVLAHRGAVVTLCPTDASSRDRTCREADVLVVLANRPRLIGGDAVKDGAVVVDGGVNAVAERDGRLGLVGDVDPDAVRSCAAALTPVPGGVGPVQTAVLLRNLVDLAKGTPPERDPSQLPLFA